MAYAPPLRLAPLLLALGATALAVIIDVTNAAPGTPLISEHGAVEMTSALLYLFGAVIWWRINGTAALRKDWEIPLVLLALMAREFDLDKAFTSVGIFKSSMYLKDTAPLWERLFGLCVIVVLALATIRLLLRHGRSLLAGMRQLALGPVALMLAVGLAVVSKSVDGLGRKLRPLGIELSSAFSAGVEVLEETMEMFIPVMVLLAILAFARGAAGQVRPA